MNYSESVILLFSDLRTLIRRNKDYKEKNHDYKLKKSPYSTQICSSKY